MKERRAITCDNELARLGGPIIFHTEFCLRLKYFLACDMEINRARKREIITALLHKQLHIIDHMNIIQAR